nr:immunoglobulin light chain junction region [Macaca mulatta]
CLQTKSCPWTL